MKNNIYRAKQSITLNIENISVFYPSLNSVFISGQQQCGQNHWNLFGVILSKHNNSPNYTLRSDTDNKNRISMSFTRVEFISGNLFHHHTCMLCCPPPVDVLSFCESLERNAILFQELSQKEIMPISFFFHL